MTGNQTSTASPEAAPPETPPVEAAAAPVSKRRVLIVEDNETARKQIQVFLETDPGLCGGHGRQRQRCAQGADRAPLQRHRHRPEDAAGRRPATARGGAEAPAAGRRDHHDGLRHHRPGRAGDAAGGRRLPDQADQPRAPAAGRSSAPCASGRCRTRSTALREKLHEQFKFHSILSKSPRMHDVFELISHVAQTISTVLIFGETGTGKELVARAVHEASPRRAAPVRRGQLRGPARVAAGERAVRPREGGVHQRRRPAQGAVRAGPRRHDLPRRDRRDPPGHAGQAAPRAAGAAVRARRRHPDRRGRRPRRRRHQPRPAPAVPRRGSSARTCTTGSTS